MSNCLKATQNNAQLAVQDYDKLSITPGVMHLGVGAFHRAHQAAYFDRLLAFLKINTGALLVSIYAHRTVKCLPNSTNRMGNTFLKQ